MSPSTNGAREGKVPFVANPFAGIAVGSPWDETPADVESINGEAFRLLQNSVQQLRAGAGGSSIVISGEPGSGKTHLLGRLKRYLETTADGDRPVYVYIRCNCSAATLRRHVRFSIADDLLKRSNAAGVSRLEEFMRRHPERLRDVPHLALRRVLECLGSGRQRLAAGAWLRGEESLTEEDLAALGIGADTDVEERSRETEAEQVLQALLRYLAPTPVVLCLDQVEALETYPGDNAGYHALGQMVAALVDGHDHLILISCVVSAYEHNIDRLPNGADRDRWLQEKATLQPIAWDDAVALIQARLDSSDELKELRRQHAADALWPLEEGAIRKLFAQTGLCLPRKLIQACRRELARCMGDSIKKTLTSEEFLQQEYCKLLAAARLQWRKTGGEKVLEDCLPWLLQHSGATVVGKSAAYAGYANMGVRSEHGEAALMFCFTRGNSFTNRLKKAAQNWRGAPQLKILSDASIQPKTGTKGALYLERLKSRGAQQIDPLPEALAALQAIRNLTAAAKAGDLSLYGDSIGEDEASEWALRNLPPQVAALRTELDVDERSDPTKTALLALLNEHRLIEAEAAGRELSLSTEEVASCARRYPMHFGILEGPPVVLFEAVEGSESEAAHA